MRKTRIIRHNQQSLALNLDWMPLLGDTTVVGRTARRMRASHKVVSGSPASALGLAYGINAKRCWSLAELFAALHPKGTYAAVFKADLDVWHVLASHEGVVLVHADRSYSDRESALRIVDQFLTIYPSLEFEEIGDIDDFLGKLIVKADESNALSKVGNNYVKYFMCMVFAAAVFGWQVWPSQSLQVAKAETLDETQAWLQSTEKVLSENNIHGLAGTKKLLNIINRQPLSVSGWMLSSMHCSSGAVSAIWLCHGEYRRQDLSADNKGFIKKAPENWHMEFPSLDLIKSRWTVELPELPLNPETLPNSKIIESDWTSELQYILPAFTALRLSPPEKIIIPPPLSEDGKELAAPEMLPRLSNRKLTVSGPLRSAVLLKKISDSIAWKKVLVNYTPGVKAGSKASSLTIQLEGNVYESNT